MLISAEQLVVPAGHGSRIIGPALVRIDGGRIAQVTTDPPRITPDIELRGGLLVPGMIDLQVNGYFGHDLVDVEEAGWARVVTRLPETGATAFLPTFITAPVARLADALGRAKALRPDLPRGARVLGVHLEGPFLSPSRAGAHNPAQMRDPDPAAVAQLLTAGGGLLRLITLAPEREHALDAIARITAAGVLVSVGHSDATAEQVAAAAAAGARAVTHLFNAQSPLRHREPGVVGQALSDARLTSGLIADLHHVAGSVCRIAFAAAPGRIALITDAAACAGMPPGEYLLGGEPIVLPPGEGVPPVRRSDGTIAGSALRMDLAVRNMIRSGVDAATAVDAATRVPADLLGRPDLGRIAPGAAADLVWLGPNLLTGATWIAGDQVFERAQAGPQASGPGVAGTAVKGASP